MSRPRDAKGRFIKTPHSKTNPPLGAETLEKVEFTTPTGKVTIEELEEKKNQDRDLLLLKYKSY